MSRKLFTIEDLYNFCVEENFSHFSVKEHGAPLVVQSQGLFSVGTESTQGLLPVTLYACHTELNRNNSYIAEDVMKKALPSIHNRPILGNIIQLDDGSYDFHSHDMRIVDDPLCDGEERMEYIERPIGVIPESCDAKLVYDKDMDKTYVAVNGYIFEDYGNLAADIMRQKGTTKVSVELCITDFSFNAQEKRLEINDFYFNGVTALGREEDGTEIGEGMLGSKMSIENFSACKNGIVTPDSQNEIVEILDKLNQTLSDFSNTLKEFKEGGQSMKLDELLKKYSVTVDDLDFEIEGLSDEELEKVFEEKFKTESEEESIEEETENEEEVSVDEDTDSEITTEAKVDSVSSENETSEEDEESAETNYTKKFSIEESGKEIAVFESFYDDITYAIENVVNLTYGESDNTYYRVKVSDNYVIMIDYFTGRSYKQTYSCSNNTYSLTGDRIEVYTNYLTREEENELAQLRTNYSSLVEKLKDYEAREFAEKQAEIFNSADYDCIRESEAFKELVANASTFSLDDLKTKCDLALLDYIKASKVFSAASTNAKSVNKVSYSTPDDTAYRPYGDLFN